MRRLRHGLAAAAAAIALTPAGASAERTVDAGSLRAEVGSAPWSLRFADSAGETVIAEHPGRGSGPTGTLGFETAAGWQHATEVLEANQRGAAYEAELATTDPDGRTILLQLSPAGEGVIALDAQVSGSTSDVEAIGIGFEAEAGERYLGFGERSNEVDQSGNVIENYVADGPYQREEYPFINLFVPSWGLRENAGSTYFPVPWLLSTAGYGVLIDNPETSRFRLRSEFPSAWSLEVTKPPQSEIGAGSAPPVDHLRLRFFAGPTPAAALRRFTAATGRQPFPDAPWAQGVWYQASEEVAAIEAMREADVPVSVLQTYLHYLPCGEQQGREAEQPARTAAIHAAGAAITTYFNPMVCQSYAAAFEPAASAGALTRGPNGAPALYRYGASPTDSNLVGQYDFLRQEGADFYAERLDEAIAAGYDGWMEDFGEYTPLDSRSGVDEIPGALAHNLYATRYHCAAHEAVRGRSRPIVRYQRSGWTGSARCAQVVWGGDPTTDWGFDGLASAVRQSLSIGASGISVWGSDIGGFFALGFNELSPELLTRWVQFGAVSAVMRTQRNGVALPPRGRPQVEDADQLANWRRWAKLHTQLYPYLAAAQDRYVRTGMPLMRHMALAFPASPGLHGLENQFLFGPDLLAAPVLEPGARERSLTLPPGRWVDLWRSARYLEGSGGIALGRAATLGPGRTTVPAPLDELPLFVRAGAVIPLLPPDVDTLTGYGRDPATVSLADRRDRIDLLAFPRGRSAASMLRGERLRSRELRGGWQLRIAGDRRRSYRLSASTATLERPLRVCSVSLDGDPLTARAWSFDSKAMVLRARFETQAGVLRAGACR